MTKKTNPVPEPKPTRAEINRQNAKKSTGPRTPEGKAASSRNAFKHGLHSKTFMLDVEDAAELDQLRDELRAEHQPANTTEEILVNDMAESFFRIRRARRGEANMWKRSSMESWERLESLILRMLNSAERSFHRALNALRQLQNHRKAELRAANAQKESLTLGGALHTAPALRVSSAARGFVSQQTYKAPAPKPLDSEFPTGQEPKKGAAAPSVTPPASDASLKAA